MKNRYEFLDALRGIAILGVIILHVSIFTVNAETRFIFRAVGEGARGVQLFYIVSALTLFLSLHSSHYLGKVSQTLKYFLRRFFRIAPLFYSILFFICFFTFIIPLDFFSYVQKDILNFVSTFSFTNSFFPVYINNIIPGQWSIAVEMLFYLLVPIFFLKIKNLSNAKKYFLYSLIFATFVELILPIMFPQVLSDDWKFFLFFSLPIQLPTFMLGFISFFLIYDKDGEKKSANNKTTIDTIKYLFCATLISEILFVLTKFIILKQIDVSLITPRIYIESVILVCLVLALANGYLPILKNKLFQFFGKISYGLYLTHFLTLMLISKLPIYIKIAKYINNVYIEYIFLLIITLIAGSIISYITYMFIETPGQKLGKIISDKFIKEKTIQ
jgi:peptidoglycan/LPS O-acetylase OafA/YrhL